MPKNWFPRTIPCTGNCVRGCAGRAFLFGGLPLDDCPSMMYQFWYGVRMKKIPAFFYSTASGRQPVRDFLKDLGKPDSGIIGADIKTVEIGWPVGMPLCKHLDGGIWEVRSNISGGRIARILFFIHQERMCLLHGFVKKTQKTPKDDLELAKKRMAELLRGDV